MRGAWDYQYRSDILISTTEEELQGRMPAHYRQKMPPPLASLALNQLQKVDRFNDARRAKAEMWDTRCAALGLRTPKVIEGSEPVFLRYPVIVPPGRKYDTEWCLRTFGVLPGHWFTGELHPLQRMMPECPNARLAVECCLNLPTLL
jgi:dTDP-4-amino-4,6-dideoxygalactose transaminase